MIVATLVYLFSMVPYAHTDVLFVDLNNADKEVAACRNGAGAGHFTAINRASNGGKPVGAAAVERAISKMEAQGKTIDSIVISGHDGSGEFFGGDVEENSFRSSDLREILAKSEHQYTAQHLKLMYGYGCYTGNVRGAENYWLNVSPYITTTVSFPVQSPSKERAPSYQMLGDLCKPDNREALGESVTLDQICRFYHNFPALNRLDASLCNREGIATKMYNDKFNKKDCYYMNDLYERCRNFDPDGKLKALYDAYFTAKAEGFEDPPLDGDDVEAPPGTSDLRKMYNSAHLYGHCVEQLNQERGYEMPDPTTIIRLVKYKQLRDNINRLNRKELNDYDRRLRDLGLGDYQLGDLSQPDEFGQVKTRDWVNRHVNGALGRLEYSARRGLSVNGTDTRTVYFMANGIKATVVDLAYRAIRNRDGACGEKDPPRRCFCECSHFSLVHAGITDSKRASKCIFTYDKGACG